MLGGDDAFADALICGLDNDNLGSTRTAKSTRVSPAKADACTGAISLVSLGGNLLPDTRDRDGPEKVIYSVCGHFQGGRSGFSQVLTRCVYRLNG